jgi:pSer/pThr/pTyr-binding forkhead associated (FHA) protein
MESDPVAVALKFGFLAVLYLFLFWVARSALKELRSTTTPAPEATGFYAVDDSPARATSDAWLVVLKGGGLDAGRRFDLFGGASVGRSTDSDIRIEDRYASQIHLRIYSQGGSYYVEDMNSTNGTFLNGSQLHGTAELQHLDRVQVGDTEFRFEIEENG